MPSAPEPAAECGDPRRRPLRSGWLVGALVFAGVALFLGCDRAPAPVAREISGQVGAVLDGDVIELVGDAGPVRVRLGGLDAPEAGQPFGPEARRALAGLVGEQVIRVRVIQERDDYGRVRGEVLRGDGLSVNEELVRSGLAWSQTRAWDDDRLKTLEGEARAARRGLWSQASPESPWDWKRRQRAGAPAAPAPAAPAQAEPAE